MKRPDEALEPLRSLRWLLDRRQGFRDTLIGPVDVAIDGSPDFVFSRYLVSQMLSDASWSAMSASPDALSSNAMFINVLYPFFLLS